MRKVIVILAACLAVALSSCGPTGDPAKDAAAVAEKMKGGDDAATLDMLKDYEQYYKQRGAEPAAQFNLELVKAGVNASAQDTLEKKE